MDTAPFRSKLEAELALVTEELRTLGVQDIHHKEDWMTTQASEPSADENEVADHVEAYDTNRAILAQLETRFNDITAALARIDGGTYGICEVGGEVIENARLEADPAARTCIAHRS